MAHSDSETKTLPAARNPPAPSSSGLRLRKSDANSGLMRDIQLHLSLVGQAPQPTGSRTHTGFFCPLTGQIGICVSLRSYFDEFYPRTGQTKPPPVNAHPSNPAKIRSGNEGLHSGCRVQPDNAAPISGGPPFGCAARRYPGLTGSSGSSSASGGSPDPSWQPIRTVARTRVTIRRTGWGVGHLVFLIPASRPQLTFPPSHSALHVSTINSTRYHPTLARTQNPVPARRLCP